MMARSQCSTQARSCRWDDCASSQSSTAVRWRIEDDSGKRASSETHLWTSSPHEVTWRMEVDPTPGAPNVTFEVSSQPEVEDIRFRVRCTQYLEVNQHATRWGHVSRACTHKRDNPGSGVIILEKNLIEIGLIIAEILMTYIFKVSWCDTCCQSQLCHFGESLVETDRTIAEK